MILSTQNINLRSNKETGREKGKKRGREKGIKNKGDNYNMNKLNVSNVGKMVGKRESFMYIVKVTFSIKFPFLWLIIFLDKLHQLIYYKCIYHQTENEKKKSYSCPEWKNQAHNVNISICCVTLYRTVYQ